MAQEVALGWGRIDRIIRDEIRKIASRVPGFDSDDLAQEARILVFNRVSLRESTSPAYVRSSIRNGLLNLKRAAYAAKRMPTDRGSGLLVSYDAFFDGWQAQGRGLMGAAGSSDDVGTMPVGCPDEMSDPEAMLTAIRLARSYRVYEQHMKSYRDLFPTAAGVPELPVLGDEGFPDCHADAPKGTGYDATSEGCTTHCPDKFSCLPRALARGLVSGAEGEIDREVEAVRAGAITYARAVQRMKRRLAIYKAPGVVPDELLPTALIPRELPEQEATPTVLASAPAPVEPAADTPQPPARKLKKRIMKPLAKAQPKPERARTGAVYGPEKLPKPCALTQAELLAKLAVATEKLCMPRGRELEIGYVIVKRRHRSGKPDVEVSIVADGFRLNTNGQVYSSLSSCAIVAEKRMVSGNEYFNLAKNHNVEVRDQHGTVICTKRTP